MSEAAKARRNEEALLVRESSPRNVEMPFWSVDDFVTPNESFYIRSHFPTPEIDRKGWRLEVTGEVEQRYELTYDEIREMEARTIYVTLECAGNNRRFLEPKMKGVQWGLGAVGNASWRGIPLAAVLARAQPRAQAVEVILEGADEGTIEERWAPPGKTRFARSVPIAKARRDVLLAYEMNGAELTKEHGFPLRAIVPGWYAMASIKWLRRIIVATESFAGYYQTLDYAFWKRTNGLPRREPLTEMQVKAQISRPVHGEHVATNRTVRVHGAAWSADGIAQVEWSGDGGATWKAARLLGDAVPHAWRLWEADWTAPSAPGPYFLLARATDSRGRTQPAQHDADHGGYMITHALPVKVEVVAQT